MNSWLWHLAEGQIQELIGLWRSKCSAELSAFSTNMLRKKSQAKRLLVRRVINKGVLHTPTSLTFQTASSSCTSPASVSVSSRCPQPRRSTRPPSAECSSGPVRWCATSPRSCSPSASAKPLQPLRSRDCSARSVGRISFYMTFICV